MPGMRGAFGCFTLLSLLFAGHPAIARVLRETPSGFVATRVLDGDEFVEVGVCFLKHAFAHVAHRYLPCLTQK
eukprot:421609-Pelagomonas_calceolata.AAC.1